MKKGDRVSIYMPMIIELVVAMLACARIGAIHSIVVGKSNFCVCVNSVLAYHRLPIELGSDCNKY